MYFTPVIFTLFCKRDSGFESDTRLFMQRNIISESGLITELQSQIIITFERVI